MPSNRLRHMLVAVLVAAVSPTTFAGDDVFTDINLDAAFEKAQEADKIVMVDFYATWCGPCKMMDKDTWPNKDVKSWIEKNAIAIKIDSDENQELAGQYKIEALPTMVFLKADKSEITRFVGGMGPSAFVEFGNRVISDDPPPPPKPLGRGGRGGSSSPRGGARLAGGGAGLAEIPSVSSLSNKAAYMRWIAMLGIAAVVSLTCFKNPKRSHDN